MKELSLTNTALRCIVDDDDYEQLQQYGWMLSKLGYVMRFASMKYYFNRTIWLHRIIAKTPEDMVTDHINGNKLDNRKVNLRVCTKSQNAINAKLRVDNKTGHKGVHFDKQRKKYMAYLTVNKQRIQLGRYSSMEEAVTAYRKASAEMHGEFARI